MCTIEREEDHRERKIEREIGDRRVELDCVCEREGEREMGRYRHRERKR